MKSLARIIFTLFAIQLLSGVPFAHAEQKSDLASCSVSLSKPINDVADAESQAVIKVLNAITRALADHDFKAMAKYLDKDCTTYDESSHKLVVGRDAIISDVESKVNQEEEKLKAPPIKFEVDRPYVQVTGERAVVSFVLIKEIAGEHPARYESHCSDIFVKRDGNWKKLHYCGDAWKEIK